MKKITVQWVFSSNRFEDMYGHKAMKVIKSNHPRFTVGTRFDYGFMGISTGEGYTVTVKPLTKSDAKKIQKYSEK